jgi:hypothetical protein
MLTVSLAPGLALAAGPKLPGHFEPAPAPTVQSLPPPPLVTIQSTLAAAASGTPIAPKRAPSRLRLTSFQLSGGFVTQGSGSYTIPAYAHWLPAYWLTPRIALSGAVGTGFLRSGSSNGLFLAPEALVFLGYVPMPLTRIEVGGGAQLWLSSMGGLAPAAAATFSWWPPGLKALPLAERVSLAYARLFATVPSHQVRLGVGFRI